MANQSNPERYIIRHLTGSKANQVEEFNFNQHSELSFGRASTSDIQFDPETDSTVSREHGKIARDANNQLSFKISDNGSRNGVFVNKQRIKESATLNLGDEVQLGANGPIFSFDIHPRPQDMMMATRMVEIPTSIRPTTEISAAEIVSTISNETPKTGIGKQTVERMMVAERKKNYGTMAAAIGGVLLVLGALGFAFKDKLFKGGENKTEIVKVDDSFNATTISEQSRKKVVQFEFAWRLYNTQTNEPLYHEFMMLTDQSGKPLATQNGQPAFAALYVQTPDGRVEPKLTSNQNAYKIPVGVSGASGSGFVVSPEGFILTNRHVATNWKTRYGFYDFCFPGVLVDQTGRPIKDAPAITAENVFSWVPSETKQFGDNGVVGKNTYLNVIFADSDQRIPVSGEPRPSDEHDVAIVKVDVPGNNLPYVEIDEKSTVKEGDPVMVMGYPGVTPNTFTVTNSKDVFNQNQQFKSIAKPTTTTGNVGAIHSKSGSITQDSKATYSEFGDAYQLTINATGGGNSGGPMFNKEGKVVGIYFAGRRTDAQISFAVPIKYGKKLFGVGGGM
jgi:serine protease Do